MSGSKVQGAVRAAALGVASLLCACTSGQSAIAPPVQGIDVANAGKLQFAVGVATVSRTTGPPIVGLNVAAAFRTPGGISPVLLNTPTITGPAGFVVPAAPVAPASPCPTPSTTSGNAGPDCPGTDAGTNHISGTPPSANPGAAPVTATTFGVIGGVFSYGFQPANTTNTNITTNEAGGSRFAPYPIPFYDPTDRRPAVGGPPDYTNYRDGNFAAVSTFPGFNLGFIPFMGATLATGAYNLNALIPSSPNSNVTVSAQASLTSVSSGITGVIPAPSGLVRTNLTGTPVPIVAPATPDPNGKGGLIVTVVVPPGASETIVNVTDTGPATGASTCHPAAQGAPYYYSRVVRGTGSQQAVFPPSVGPVDPGTLTTTPTFCAGDRISIVAYAFDYPAYESGVGLPGQQTPPQAAALTGGTFNQADVTISPAAILAPGVF